MSDLSKTRLVELAEEKLSDAKILLGAGSFSNAYYIAGYAVEIMLKAIIVRQFKAETLPDKKLVRDIHVHDLNNLASLAGLGDRIKELQAKDADFLARWQIVQAWSEEVRYRPSSEDKTKALVDALDDPGHGVMQWLRQHL